jgi:hypothetical protein
MTAEETLRELYSLLGKAVLLPIPLREKGPQFPGWQKLTFAQRQERRSELIAVAKRGGNLGVLLGPESDRLLALDLDEDDVVDEWLACHPWLANTLRSRGKRGCQFWLRLEAGAQYPNGKAVYKLPNGAGELRVGGVGGAQSVIWGQHPAGMRYKIEVDKSPLVVSLADLDELAPGILCGSEVQQPERPRPASTNGSNSRTPTNLWHRIIRYLDTCEPAVSGQRGHDTTYRVLCQLIKGFALSPEQALEAANYYNGKCEPPWSEKELKHKVDDALAAPSDKQPGYLLEAGNEPPLSQQLKKEQSQPRQAESDSGRAGDRSTSPLRGKEQRKPQLVLPSGDVSITESAEQLFEVLGKKGRYFVRGRLVMELANNKEGNEILTPLRAIALRSRMEADFELLSWRQPAGEPVLKRTRCPKDIAEAFLETNAAIELLPGIRLLVSSPIMNQQDGKLLVLNKGYHEGRRNLR